MRLWTVTAPADDVAAAMVLEVNELKRAVLTGVAAQAPLPEG